MKQRTIHILARRWEKTRFSTTLCTKLRILTMHSVHICSWGTYIRDITCKSRKIIQATYFLKNGLFASLLNEFTLMCCDGTEITTSKTASMSVDREFDHFKCRNVLTLITWVRLFCKRQIPE